MSHLKRRSKIFVSRIFKNTHGRELHNINGKIDFTVSQDIDNFVIWDANIWKATILNNPCESEIFDKL